MRGSTSHLETDPKQCTTVHRRGCPNKAYKVIYTDTNWYLICSKHATYIYNFKHTAVSHLHGCFLFSLICVLTRLSSFIHFTTSRIPASSSLWMNFLVGMSYPNISDRRAISLALFGYVRKSAGLISPSILISLMSPFSTVR